MSQTPSAIAGFFRPAVSAVLLGVSLVGAVSATAVAAPTQTVDNAKLAAALDSLLALDANADGKVVGRTWGNELSEAGPLARAVFEYVDYVNPRGTTSFWGPSSGGDYMVGGLGVGFTLRPAHMTGNRVLTETDLREGVHELSKRLAGLPRTYDTSLIDADLAKIRELGAAQGLFAEGEGEASVLEKIHQGAESLIERIADANAAKERATRREVARVGTAEMIGSLEEGSLERLIAEVTLSADHGGTFFKRELGMMPGVKREHRADEMGDVQSHYLLALGKHAMEGSLVARVAALL